MDEKILAYRSEIQKRSENTPFWTRTILTVEEAAAYTGIAGKSSAMCRDNSDGRCISCWSGSRLLVK